MTDAQCLATRTELLSRARLLPLNNPVRLRCERMAKYLLGMTGDDPILRAHAWELYEAEKADLANYMAGTGAYDPANTIDVLAYVKAQREAV